MEFVLMGVSIAAGALGILLAAVMHFEPWAGKRPAWLDPAVVRQQYRRLHGLLDNKYYLDEIYAAVIVNPLMRACRWCLGFDLTVIDGLVNGAGWLTRLTAWFAHKIDIYLVDGVINSLATLVRVNSGLWRRATGFCRATADFVADCL
jgi:NADH-quinone oxidoreductase subunit L